MIDVINALNNLVPAASYGGTVEYEQPTGDGGFRTLSLDEVRAMYESLRWNDPRPQPTWDEIVAYDTAHPPLRPLLGRLTELVGQLTDTQQIGLGSLISLVYVTLATGNQERARSIVQGATVPAELETLRGVILEEFDK